MTFKLSCCGMRVATLNVTSCDSQPFGAEAVGQASENLFSVDQFEFGLVASASNHDASLNFSARFLVRSVWSPHQLVPTSG